jgi:hypothetical protein
MKLTKPMVHFPLYDTDDFRESYKGLLHDTSVSGLTLFTSTRSFARQDEEPCPRHHAFADIVFHERGLPGQPVINFPSTSHNLLAKPARSQGE